jgi:hypothetical protein
LGLLRLEAVRKRRITRSAQRGGGEWFTRATRARMAAFGLFSGLYWYIAAINIIMRFNTLHYKLSNSKFLTAVVATTILLIFRKFFEGIITRVFVLPFLSQCEPSLLIDFVILSTSLLVSVYFISKMAQNHQASITNYVIILLITFIYSYYRFYNISLWEFYSFSLFNNVKYGDGLLLAFFLNTLLVIENKLYKHKTSNSRKGFFTDAPLGEEGEDELNREDFANEIAERIKGTSENSLAIGIVGSWGSGKTSFIDLIKRKLEDKIIIDFNPFDSSSATTIISDFFIRLQEELSKYSSQLSGQIVEYSEKLLENSDNKFAHVVKQSLKVYNPELKQQKININNAIKKLNKQVVVFIDDLDRLDKTEIVEVIRLVRNTASFKNTIFIAAYDRNYILNALKEINGFEVTLYLEKIFQMEILLPQYEKGFITETLLRNLKKGMPDEYHKELEEIFSNRRFEKGLIQTNQILTKRDVVRFTNAFLTVFDKLKGEIVIEDLINCEILKLKYPSVYDLIFSNKRQFLMMNKNRAFIGDKNNYILATETIQESHNSKTTVVIKDYLEKYHEKLSTPYQEIDNILLILNEIFPKNSMVHREDMRSVVFPSSIDRYSHYRLLNGDLSEVQFSNARRQSQSNFNEYLKQMVDKKLRYNLYNRLLDIREYDDKEDFEKIIKGIFYFAQIPANKNNSGFEFTGYDDDNLYRKLYNGENEIGKKYYNGDATLLENFVRGLITDPENAHFSAGFINYLLKHDYSFVLTKEELEKTRLAFLQNHLDGLQNFEHTVFYYYNRCRSFEFLHDRGTRTTIEKPNPAANTIVIDFLNKKDVDGFLQIGSAIGYDIRNKNLFYLSDIVNSVFGSLEEFKKFILEYNSSKSKYIEEFKKFMSQVDETNLKKPIPFDFKIIPKLN